MVFAPFRKLVPALFLMAGVLGCTGQTQVVPSGPWDAATDAGSQLAPSDSGLPDIPEKPVVDCRVQGLEPSLGAPRGSPAASWTRESYDYAPSIHRDGRYRMWWCGGLAGDHILQAEADSPAGPWLKPGTTEPGYAISLAPTLVEGTFDRIHACEPTVVRNGNIYVMYYTGWGDFGGVYSRRIGVATSADGVQWTRQNSGKPIILPQRLLTHDFGAGRASVIVLEGMYYLMYSDTSGFASNSTTKGGVYVVRSKDMLFSEDVEVLTAKGFESRILDNQTLYALTDALQPDWQYSDALDAFVMVSMVSGNAAAEVRLFSRSFAAIGSPIRIGGNTVEGPGLVRRADGHAVPSPTCNRVPVDVFRAIGTDSPTWDLSYVGGDLVSPRPCECVDFGKVYEGTVLVSPGKPVAVVKGGVRLLLPVAATVGTLARLRMDVPNATYDTIRLGGTLRAQAKAFQAPNRPMAFLIDDNRLWPTDCAALLSQLQSEVINISVVEYDSHPVGPLLNCVR